MSHAAGGAAAVPDLTTPSARSEFEVAGKSDPLFGLMEYRMTTRKSRGLPSQIEQLMESALAPGCFISYKANYDFVRNLSTVERRIAGLVPIEPHVAVSHYETFIAGCHEKAEEIDDSSGSFGQFVGDLFCGWIKARQAAHANPDDTVIRLLAWMDDDPYGFCYQLERDAAKVLNKAGLAAFEKQVRARLAAAATMTETPGASPLRGLEYRRRRCGEILRAIYLAQRDVEAFASLCEATGPTAKDCQDLATMLVSRRKPEVALSWVERGLALDAKDPHGSITRHDLDHLKRDLLTKLGRGKEALEAAWVDFQAHPGKYSYDDLMKYVPKTERRAWHKKAIDAATGTDLYSLIELLIETRETARLASLVDQSKDSALQGVSHYASEPAAKRLEKTHPHLAARLWCTQGMRVVNAKKSKYYDAALSNFARARRCYEKAGLKSDWERVVSKVRSEHRRKRGFMAGFEEIVTGTRPRKKPSFLARAKARWGPRPSRSDG